MHRAAVIKWRRQYAEDGLEDAPRPGGPKAVLTDRAIGEIMSVTVPRCLSRSK